MLRARQDPPRESWIFDKNATPAPHAAPVEDVFAHARPQAITEERRSRNVDDINAQHAVALSGYSPLRVQTDSELEQQWESHYVPAVFQWEIPRMVGGVDYWPEKGRWRRTEPDVAVVTLLR